MVVVAALAGDQVVPRCAAHTAHSLSSDVTCYTPVISILTY